MPAIWLINLFGVPYAPSSYNPDNSLAALAGSLKQSGFHPLILDFQTPKHSLKLMPPFLGGKILNIVKNVNGKLSESSKQEIARIDAEILKYQRLQIEKIAADLMTKAQKEKPLFIGFKLYSGDGNEFSRLVARIMRSKIQVPLLAGGPLIRVIGAARYRQLYPEFDFILDGEADRSIVSFAKFVQGETPIENVKGLCYFSKSKNGIVQNQMDIVENLSDLADPCYDQEVYPALYEKNQKSMVFQLDESRGCPNNCSFCVHPQINDRMFRINPAEKMLNQILEIQNKFSAFAFRFTGSNTPKSFLKEFSKQVLSAKAEIKYSCFASVNTTPIETIKELRSSGLAGVFIGAETSDENILKNVFNKTGQNKDKLSALLNACFENEVYATTSWIYPMPDYTTKMKQGMIEYITELYGGRSMDVGSVMVVPSVLLPNTDWFFNRKKYGFEVANEMEYYQDYAELNMRFWLPRSLMRSMKFTMQNQSFESLSEECDIMVEELSRKDIPLGVTDDWMLQGMLSGTSMLQFKEQASSALLNGDISKMETLIENINSNSKNKAWNASRMSQAS
jgi:radical SAM superfamily enzyme YgiQ (UPF0313 family)